MGLRKDFILSDPQVIKCPKIFKKGQQISLTVKCIQCKQHINISLNNYWKRRKRNFDKSWQCNDCIKPGLIEQSKNNSLYRSQEYRNRFRELHNDPEYYKKVHNRKVRDKISKASKIAWTDPEKKKRHLEHRQTCEFKSRISEWSKNKWQDPEYRDKQNKIRSDSEYKDAASKRSKKLWRNPEFRKKQIKHLNKARLECCKNNISSLQLLLYEILDDMNIDYYKEGLNTIIGPIVVGGREFMYTFDCMIPNVDDKNLYIEVHGEYWYNEKTEHKDRAKATFLTNHIPNSDLLVIWEHEFRSRFKVTNIIASKLGHKHEQVDFNFSDVIIRTIKITDELKSLFARYHYMANIGRFGSIRYGAFIEDKLAAAVVFSNPTRQNSAQKHNIAGNEILELTRFVIHPRHQKKNFASWFLSRALKRLWKDKPKIKKVITFADTTYHHDGTIYKATNWQFSHEVKPDYWYIDNKGCWYHKKTIWDMAKRIHMTEPDYVNKNGLKKIIGNKNYVM